MHLVMIGASDAGIGAALRARELDPIADVTVVLADAFPQLLDLRDPVLHFRRGHRWRNLVCSARSSGQA